MVCSEPQHELRRRLLALVKEHDVMEFRHKDNAWVEVGRMVGMELTKTQYNRAIGKLHAVGAISVRHPIVFVDGVATRRHVLRFLKDVEL